MRVGKLKNGKATGKKEFTGEIVKAIGDRAVDWIWNLCNMAFKSGVMLEDWRSAVIGKGERTECKDYRGIVGKIYVGILVDRVRRVTGGLKEVKMGMGRRGESGDYLAFFMQMRIFVELCRRRGLKVNAGNSKVLGEEEGLECEVYIDMIRLGHVSEFKYLGCVFDESSMAEAECSKKVASGSRVAVAIRSLVNARNLQLDIIAKRVYVEECAGNSSVGRPKGGLIP